MWLCYSLFAYFPVMDSYVVSHLGQFYIAAENVFIHAFWCMCKCISVWCSYFILIDLLVKCHILLS